MESEAEILHPGASQTIADLLPRYYETHGEDPSYETVRSMVMDGHKAANVKVLVESG